MVYGRLGSSLATKASSKNKPEDDPVPSCNVIPPPLPLSDVAVCGPTPSDRLESFSHDDIVIAVMGPTGVGKSSFVNTTSGREEATVGFDLRSKTRALQVIRCPHPDSRRNIVLVDTPGFDDTHLSDSQILRIIASWLKDTYENGIKLSGLLYLHRISDVRMAGTPLRNLAVFQDLCGNDNLKNVVLVTTMWDEIEDELVGSKREQELLSSFWKGMIDHGSRTCRYQGTHESAWAILDLLDLNGPRRMCAPLQIQREMVDRKLPLHETAAAKTLLRSLVQAVVEFKMAWQKVRSGLRRKNGSRNPPAGLRRIANLSRSSTIRSSETSWSIISSTYKASISSRDSASQPSPTTTMSSGCSITGSRDALLATITGLNIAHQVADMAGIPILRGTIGTILQIARAIQAMGGTHHAITQVVESSGWLLEEIAQHAAESKLTKDMKTALKSFRMELNNLQKVVMRIKERNFISRFFLHEADIQAITACTASIKQIYNKLEVKLAMDNRQAIARLEDQLRELCNRPALWKCECHGVLVVPEDLPDNGQNPPAVCQSTWSQ